MGFIFVKENATGLVVSLQWDPVKGMGLRAAPTSVPLHTAEPWCSSLHTMLRESITEPQGEMERCCQAVGPAEVWDWQGRATHRHGSAKWVNGVTTWCRGDGNGHLQYGCCPSAGSKHYRLQSGFRQFANNETIETKQYKKQKNTQRASAPPRAAAALSTNTAGSSRAVPVTQGCGTGEVAHPHTQQHGCPMLFSAKSTAEPPTHSNHLIVMGVQGTL